MRLFEQINVWHRIDDSESVCYRCFRLLPDGGYCVQSADFFRLNDGKIKDFDQQQVELFLERSPDERSGLLPTLYEAIKRFQEEFES
jgi:hypothetical protein